MHNKTFYTRFKNMPRRVSFNIYYQLYIIVSSKARSSKEISLLVLDIKPQLQIYTYQLKSNLQGIKPIISLVKAF